ncbi:MAG: sensor histidine kinase, partial [Flavobacteriales bacterium]
MSLSTVRTPRQVALASASLITGLLAVTYFLVIYLLEREFTWLPLAILLVLGFAISYGIVFYFIERFLYHKVKIIYKTIHSLKSQGDARPKIQMSEDVMNEINKEVADWADQKIREVKELRSAENYRREFIGNLAHELKTPVFNVQGYIETLLETELNDAELNRKFLEKANNGCERLVDLLKDLDQIASIESGNMELEWSRFDVVELIKQTIELLEQPAADRSITLRLGNAAEKPILVSADRKRIQQVIVNLLMNSISYGKESGETRVRFYDMDD